ncbi:hypothetical protein [Phenylobacterium sp.]|uniref:hypothetical protein n=1 Tax=Phenylobacterium sp. TaxID=1871053 RepID=UPI0030F42087
MRLPSLIPALAVLALAACDSTGALKIAQAPAAKPADCCCKPVTTTASCPPVDAPTPVAAQPAAMTPEPERVVHRPAAPHRPARPAARRMAPVQRDHVQREYAEVRQYGAAQQRTYVAAPEPVYETYVEVPDLRGQVRVVSAEAHETYGERYAEQSEGYGSGDHRYAGGYEARGGYEQRGGGRGCGGCAPREAAGRDRNGFLTWPGKVPARP